MTLIVDDKKFELIRVPTEHFLLTQKELYPMEHRVYSAYPQKLNLPQPEMEFAKLVTYEYRSIVIDRKFYGFKLIENE